MLLININIPPCFRSTNKQITNYNSNYSIAYNFSITARAAAAFRRTPPLNPIGPTGAGGSGANTGAGGSGAGGSGAACGQGTLILGSLPAVAGGAMVEGDFNRDGKLDLAGLGSLLLGKGDGTFTAAASFQVASGARALAAGDVNNDGKLDLLIANYLEYSASTSSVSVFLGKGDGTFAARKDYAAGDGAYALAVGDADGDGDLDIVTANNRAGTVSVFLGKGDGTFAARVDYAAGGGPRGPLMGTLTGTERRTSPSSTEPPAR